MKIDEFIKYLLEIKDKHGDLKVNKKIASENNDIYAVAVTNNEFGNYTISEFVDQLFDIKRKYGNLRVIKSTNSTDINIDVTCLLDNGAPCPMEELVVMI